jgi:hypothetical protein|mmetsp:Transcript_20451/g.37126  ORF Transcript_20451/g.37126 Transcript_20451/m.37126 type:complete len:82 (-) Transcript_20451:25-270(-)
MARPSRLTKVMTLRSIFRRSASWRRRFLEKMPSFQSASSRSMSDKDVDSSSLSPFESDWRDSIEEKHEPRDDLALLQFKLL